MDSINGALTALNTEAQLKNAIRAHNSAPRSAAPVSTENDKQLLKLVNAQLSEARKDKPIIFNKTPGAASNGKQDDNTAVNATKKLLNNFRENYYHC